MNGLRSAACTSDLEMMMAEKIIVHDPRGYPPKVVGKRLANRPESLDGKVLYLIDCLFGACVGSRTSFMGQQLGSRTRYSRQAAVWPSASGPAQVWVSRMWKAPRGGRRHP